MTFAEYINWIIKHISDYEVNYFKCSSTKEGLDQAPDRFIITYTDPDTGRKVHVLNIKVDNDNIIDTITGLTLANKSEVYINALKDFGLK